MNIPTAKSVKEQHDKKVEENKAKFKKERLKRLDGFYEHNKQAIVKHFDNIRETKIFPEEGIIRVLQCKKGGKVITRDEHVFMDDINKLKTEIEASGYKVWIDKKSLQRYGPDYLVMTIKI